MTMRERRKAERGRGWRMRGIAAAILAATAAVSASAILPDGGSDGKPAETESRTERPEVAQAGISAKIENALKAAMEEAENAPVEDAADEDEDGAAEPVAKQAEKPAEDEDAAESEADAAEDTGEPAAGEKPLPAGYDNLPLLWNMVEAEAGNQGLAGKRLVACVALNRVDSPEWPDTITGVITQDDQFSSYSDGGMERWSEISEETKEAVAMEIEERSYPGLIYFTAGGYGRYGTPYMKYKDHYFSTK